MVSIAVGHCACKFILFHFLYHICLISFVLDVAQLIHNKSSRNIMTIFWPKKVDLTKLYATKPVLWVYSRIVISFCMNYLQISSIKLADEHMSTASMYWMVRLWPNVIIYTLSLIGRCSHILISWLHSDIIPLNRIFKLLQKLSILYK